MFLIPVEPLGFALPTMPHLRILDRDSTLGSHAFADTHSAVSVRLKVLRTNLNYGIDIRLKRAFNHVVDVSFNPPMKRGNLTLHDFDRCSFLSSVAPIDVEAGLNARSEEQRYPGLSSDLFGVSIRELRHDFDNLSCGMPEQVERVLNPPGPH